MPRIKDELRTEDLTDIEEGQIPRKCRACGAKQVILVRLDGYEENKATQTKIGVCSRKLCFRYVEISEVPTWARIMTLQDF